MSGDPVAPRVRPRRRQLFGSFGAGQAGKGMPGLRSTRIMRSAISRPR
jgi:hypothetical protein